MNVSVDMLELFKRIGGNNVEGSYSLDYASMYPVTVKRKYPMYIMGYDGIGGMKQLRVVKRRTERGLNGKRLLKKLNKVDRLSIRLNHTGYVEGDGEFYIYKHPKRDCKY